MDVLSGNQSRDRRQDRAFRVASRRRAGCRCHEAIVANTIGNHPNPLGLDASLHELVPNRLRDRGHAPEPPDEEALHGDVTLQAEGLLRLPVVGRHDRHASQECEPAGQDRRLVAVNVHDVGPGTLDQLMQREDPASADPPVHLDERVRAAGGLDLLTEGSADSVALDDGCE